jgi:hypothetical protein
MRLPKFRNCYFPMLLSRGKSNSGNPAWWYLVVCVDHDDIPLNGLYYQIVSLFCARRKTGVHKSVAIDMAQTTRIVSHSSLLQNRANLEADT